MLSLWAIIGWTAPAIVVEPPLPDGCPIASAVLARLLDAAPDAPADPAQGRLRIRITQSADTLQAALTVERPGQPPAVRTLDGVATDCRALVSAVALTAALIVEPLPTKTPRAAEPEAPPPTEPVKEPSPPKPEKSPTDTAKTPLETPVAPTEVAPADPPASPPNDPPAQTTATVGSASSQHWQLHAGLLAATGPLPAMGMVLDLGADWLSTAWRVGLSGRLHLALPGDVAQGTVSGQLALVHASGCRRGARWAACALVGYGLQWLEGADFEANRAADGAYLAVGARGEYSLPLTADWSIAAVIEAHAPISRLRLTVDGERAWSTPAVLGALGADLCFRF